MKVYAESQIPDHVPYLHLGYTSAMSPDIGPFVVMWGALVVAGGIASLWWLVVALWRALGLGEAASPPREWRGIRAFRLEEEQAASLSSSDRSA